MPNKQLTVGDLIETNEIYDNNINEWNLLVTVFEGIRSIVNAGYITRHEREPMISYRRRMEELFGFGYTKSVVEIFHFFLFKKEPLSKLGGLLEDKLWQLFDKDSNLYGMDYNTTIMDIALWAAVQGHMGILVDKANAHFKTKEQQIREKVYPYIAKYHPQSILDWMWSRDTYNRPFLSYLKLEDEGSQYRIWTPDNWEIWELPKDKNGQILKSDISANGVFIDEGVNPLGEIPFLWFYNQRSKKIALGKSDVHEVSRIDLSIIRNMSQSEEIINYAAFPMMRKPLRDARPTDLNAPQQEDEVSVQSVLEFDPENPESKPDWLEAQVSEPITSILEFVEKKISEIYRAANIGGMTATEPTKYSQSGIAKKVDFQLLNSKMIAKATNLEDAENKILEYWCRWEGVWEKYKNTAKMARAKSYDIEDLTAALDDALTAKTVVFSRTFDSLLQKQTARLVLPAATEQQMAEIDKEIDVAIQAERKIEEFGIDNPSMNKEDREIIDIGIKTIPKGEVIAQDKSKIIDGVDVTTLGEEDFKKYAN